MKAVFNFLAALPLVLLASVSHADNHAAPSKPVGMAYAMEVSDPSAFVSAMSKYWSSPTGKQLPGFAILRQVVAAGESSATHSVAVVYPSYEALDTAFAINAQSEDWSAFLGEIGGIADVVSASMFEATGLGSMENQLGAGPGMGSLYYFISVSDPAQYAAAFQEMLSSTDTGETDTMLFSVPAGAVDGTTHVVSVTGKSVGAVMSQITANRADEAFAAFIGKVQDIREVTQVVATVDVAVFGNSGQ